MTDNKKVPRLRFKEFTDAWEQRKLDDTITHKSGTSIEKYFSSKGLYKVISIGSYGSNGKYIDQGIRAAANEKTNSHLIKKGELSMVLNDKTGGKIIGRVLLIEKNNQYVVNQRSEIIKLSTSLWDPQFAFTYLNGPFRKKVLRIMQGGTQNYVNFSSVKKLTASLTSVKEQKEIGTLFQKLDNIIILQQRKLNLLNQLKKGMLQKLFAGKNQKQPNLRFKGLADTWKKETLKEVSQWSKGQGLPKKDLNTYEKGKEVIHYADLYKLGPVIKGVIHWSTSKEGRKIPTNSIIFPMSDVTPTGLARTSAVVKDGILAGGDVLIDNLSSKIQSKFLSYEINANSHQILSLVTGTTVKHITSKSLNRLSITYPNMQEQEMISNTLENIFTQIEFYRYRISKLQQLKKSLLQNMFI